MSWIQKLYETYERCASAPQFDGQLLPVSHTEQQAHIEIVLDEAGNFQRAALVEKETTVVPATEESAGRVGTKPPPHPLCDKIQYCAADYEAFGGAKEPFFDDYVKQLRQWQAYEATPKASAVLSYVEKRSVVADLTRSGILTCGLDGRLLTEWKSDSPIPDLLKMLPPKEKKRDQGDAFVRWLVQVPGDSVSAVWKDSVVRDSWIRFDTSQTTERGLCIVTGEVTELAASHPKRLRHGADQAKLISSNDLSGFTFRGRVDASRQAFGVGYDVTQKAHSALRWLIKRQGYNEAGDPTFVAWAVNGKDVPDPLADTAKLFADAGVGDSVTADAPYSGDAGQHFALRLKKAISGYRADLGDSDDVVVMGLGSATPGRMAITYYRELTGSEFLERVSAWHAGFAWPQRTTGGRRYVGAPSPGEIAEATYGKRIEGKIGAKLRKFAVERLVPCIVDARPLPRELVAASVRRVINRMGFEKEKGEEAEWEKCLGIACALVRGSKKEENYQMSLEENRNTRDYLFGRLLAIAENIEQRALYLANEQRDTSAAKLTQRFAEHPCSTWRTIEKGLYPYKARLRTNRPTVLLEREKLLDKVMGMFKTEDFISADKLSGEFLLGYHCQRSALWPDSNSAAASPDEDKSEVEGEKS